MQQTKQQGTKPKKTDRTRLAAGAREFLLETPRFLDEWICGFKEIAAYFLSSARVRWSFMAVVRRVSGTFLLEVRRFRSTALSMGSMCRVTSSGVLGLLTRLRTTV